MEKLSVLGAYLITALLLPGVIVLAAAAILFPEFRNALATASPAEQIGAVLLSSFFSGHLPYLLERCCINRVWAFVHSSYRLAERSVILAERDAIVARCDVRCLNRRHLDLALSEFILYYNTSFWCLILSVSSAIHSRQEPQLFVAIFIGSMSLIALLFTAPLYKAQMIGVLESLKQELETASTESPKQAMQPTRESFRE